MASPSPTLTLVYDDFSVPDSGRLDVTLDWTFASSPVGFYLVPANTCTLAEFNARSCNFLIRSETTVKPRKISMSQLHRGQLPLDRRQLRRRDESVSLQITCRRDVSRRSGSHPPRPTVGTRCGRRSGAPSPAEPSRGRPPPWESARGADVPRPVPWKPPGGWGIILFRCLDGPVLGIRAAPRGGPDSRKDRKG